MLRMIDIVNTNPSSFFYKSYSCVVLNVINYKMYILSIYYLFSPSYIILILHMMFNLCFYHILGYGSYSGASLDCFVGESEPILAQQLPVVELQLLLPVANNFGGSNGRLTYGQVLPCYMLWKEL